MAVVARISTGQRWTVSAHQLVGRSRRSTLRIDDPAVSAEHAILLWRDGRWFVRDLGSTNGTFVDGVRAESPRRVELQSGSTVHFGGLQANLGFRLVDAGTPGAAAVELTTGQRRQAVHGVLQLPDPSNPELTIFQDEIGRWTAERDGEPVPVSDQQTVQTSVSAWLLELPPESADPEVGTTAPGHPSSRLDRLGMTFCVSADEEFVQVHLRLPSGRLDLSPRSFHYMLLTLARRRLASAEAGEAPAEQGWMYTDELARQLAMTRQKLNLDVCRARQQMAEAGISGAGLLIERRATTGQLRIGVADLQVSRL